MRPSSSDTVAVHPSQALARVASRTSPKPSDAELTNGIPSPHPWSVNRASAAQILSDAHRARRDGAQVVIVNIHWGDQYVAQPSSFQLQLASTLTRSPDITAIVGQHVHIVQPIRIMHGKPVVFGEGNLISNQTSACCPAAAQDGMIVLLAAQEQTAMGRPMHGLCDGT